MIDFGADAETLAQALLGAALVRLEADGARTAGRIVETEAYLGGADRASHTRGGHRSPRVESMYLPGGHAYVYLIYGLHHCLNVVAGAADEGTAVLVRALEPTEGLERMRARRPAARHDRELCRGPGRLAAALGIDRRHDGLDLRPGAGTALRLEPPTAPVPASGLERSPRIGVDSAGAWAAAPLRFAVAGSPFVSRSGRSRAGRGP